ncbi:uncharacterized protein LOC143064197 isoform X1 [Mytilus galloprovincialis]|uniref:uncharacterized protein LOC143064197 isoform X1 n=1 Tax=Mytilus galloprovincialis TaxID=29158 RepID=UPI003F7B8B8B
MKFYVHSEDPEITLVIKWDKPTGTISDLSEIVTESLKKKIYNIMNEKMQLVFKIRGKILSNDDAVTKKIKNMDDVDVLLKVLKTSNEDQRCQQVKKSTDIIKDYILKAKNLMEKHRARTAILLYEEVLDIDPKCSAAFTGLVDCYLQAKRPQKALFYLGKLQKLQITDTTSQVLFRFAQCYLKLSEADKAIDFLQKYCIDLKKSGGTDTQHKHQVQVLLAKAYLVKGEKDMAIVLLQGILRQDKTFVDALVEYAPLLYPLGPAQSEEAMTILLTLLANDKDNSYIREKFTWAVQQPDGLKILKSVAGKAWSDIASLVFMATSVRECGGVDEAISIMEHAYDLKKSDPHTLLTYVHMLELIGKQYIGIQLIKKYIEDFPDMAIGNFTCRNLHNFTKFLSTEKFSAALDKELVVESTTQQEDTFTFTPDQLYLLALLHTFVKILFVKGYLDVLPVITDILDPISVNKDLHLTNIRNEAAYFTCISKVMKTKHNLQFDLEKEKFIYLVGDSHCITSAWQHIKFKEETVTIHPVLSTGTKIWHLREESQFYPKINFYNEIKVIPDNAAVMLCFGEIDCREALLLCVEKAKYDSIEEAIDKVIDIYIEVIKDLYKKYNWNIYIHPVMPVLDITRSLVMQFNLRLKKRIKKESTIKWLQFVDELLYTNEDNSLVLKDCYKFDGTHVHPRYTALLETSLRTCTDL